LELFFEYYFKKIYITIMIIYYYTNMHDIIGGSIGNL